jgi:hypothetical protein
MKDIFPHVHFIHCYIPWSFEFSNEATMFHSEINKTVFASVSGFRSFLSTLPKLSDLLRPLCGRTFKAKI